MENEELEIFNEEAAEQLQYMENALVEATDSGVDDEKIGAIFRAMHTIKGSAGMFGYDDVVSFTHVAENILDEVRNKNIILNDSLISLFLECKDHTGQLLELASNEAALDGDLKNRDSELLSKLKACMPNSDKSIEHPISSAPVETVKDNNDEDSEIIFDTEEATWHISIRFNQDFFSTGLDIISIFNFMNNIGELLSVTPITELIPSIEDIEPVKTFIGFELFYLAEADTQMIKDIFDFAEDSVDLLILKQYHKKALKQLLKRREPYIKELFIDNGIYSEEDFDFDDEENDIIIVEDEIKIVEAQDLEIEIKKQAPVEELTTRINKAPTSNSAKKIAKKASSSLRVDSHKIDILINQMSEMVIANARISNIASQSDSMELEEASTLLSELLEQIRDGIMDIRMVQVGDSFMKFKRIVNDVAKKIGKDVDFVISGGDTELDKTVIEKITDPLMHMLRNSVDHGIETPDERINIGKDPKGRVDLRAYPDAGTIIIEIEDDGKGLDKEKLLAKAISNGIVDKNNKLTEKEIFELIFAAGLSTADTVSDISGRGVGMDVVRRNIEDLRGTIDVESKLGKGSKITVRLPLTLAIIDGFLVQAGQTKYVIPLDMIQECIELTGALKEDMKGNQYVNLRNAILPILDIREYFREKIVDNQRENIVVVKYAEKMVGLRVDELYGEHQTVIKPLGSTFENVPGISGGSILGSGDISLIFDIPSLIDYRLRQKDD